eukprot:646031-Pleurochrysis_carterae.AAC.1
MRARVWIERVCIERARIARTRVRLRDRASETAHAHARAHAHAFAAGSVGVAMHGFARNSNSTRRNAYLEISPKVAKES